MSLLATAISRAQVAPAPKGFAQSAQGKYCREMIVAEDAGRVAS